MSGAWSQLLAGLAARRRRALIRALLAQADIRELVWLPPPGSPLHHGESTVKLAMDQVIGPRTLAFGHWHDEHCALLRARLAPGQRYHLIDVGANAGLVSRQLLAAPAAPFVGADCFEPDPHNHALLAHNLAPFAGVRTHEAALSDADGEAELFRGARNAGDISLAPGARLRAQGDLQRRLVRLVDGHRFGEALLAALPADVRLVWKSDTQGHDIRIANAMPDALWERVDAAMIEVRSVPLEPAARDRFLALVSRFPHCHSIKRGLRRFGPDELRAFLARESEQELDLLLARRG